MRSEILDGRPWVMTEDEARDYYQWMLAFDLTSPNPEVRKRTLRALQPKPSCMPTGDDPRAGYEIKPLM